MKTIISLSALLLSLHGHAQIKPEHNAIACLSVNKSTGVKALVSFVLGNEEADIIGADEKRKLADVSSLFIEKTSVTDSVMKVDLMESTEIEIRDSLIIDLKTGKAKLGQKLAYENDYRLFNQTTFNCYDTTYKKESGRDRFRSNTFLKNLGLPAINSDIQYRNVACSEWDNFCSISIKL